MNATNLEALGATRSAELLIEVSSRHAPIQRRLRLELAVALGPSEMAHQILKQIFTISRSRALVNWQTRKALLDDLNGLDKAIPDIAKIKPVDALELMWRYLALSESIFARSDDSSGKLLGVFERAWQSLAEIALQAKPDPIQLTDHTNELTAEPRDLAGVVASAIGLLSEPRHRGRPTRHRPARRWDGAIESGTIGFRLLPTRQVAERIGADTRRKVSDRVKERFAEAH